jgi:hypothetical protein
MEQPACEKNHVDFLKLQLAPKPPPLSTSANTAIIATSLPLSKSSLCVAGWGFAFGS